MAKKQTYNGKPREELTTELAKLKGSLRALEVEKMKTGKAVGFRTAKKNIARVMTAMHAGQLDK